MSDARFDRIEAKLDKMSEAITTLARMEERMITLFKRMDTLDATQDDQGDRLRKIEGKVGNNGQALRFAERLFWIVLAAGVSYLFWMARG